jgi:hypothetical protein
VSDDLVKRLRRDSDVADRSHPEVFHVSADLAREAADRIEALEREVELLLMGRQTVMWMEKYQTARNEALEEAAGVADERADHWCGVYNSRAFCENEHVRGLMDGSSELALRIRALKEEKDE